MSFLSRIIPELRSIPEVRTLSDVLRIQDFVFSLIPYTKEPFLEKIGIEKNGDVKVDLIDAYKGCKEGSIGGWCGINAEFLRLVLVTYGVKCRPYNYGIAGSVFTHVCLIVEFSGIKFLLDPYFNRVYTYENDFILQFPDLLRLIREDNTKHITSLYGLGKKKIQAPGGFKDYTGIDLELSVMGFFKVKDFESALRDYFNSSDPMSLMLREIPL